MDKRLRTDIPPVPCARMIQARHTLEMARDERGRNPGRDSDRACSIAAVRLSDLAREHRETTNCKEWH